MLFNGHILDIRLEDSSASSVYPSKGLLAVQSARKALEQKFRSMCCLMPAISNPLTDYGWGDKIEKTSSTVFPPLEFPPPLGSVAEDVVLFGIHPKSKWRQNR
jgi:hypothetical protein